jgi:hypothetical protein
MGLFSMIDREWLDESLHYDLSNGRHLSGVLGVGGQKVVINYLGASGDRGALYVDKWRLSLACYLHELPTWITPSPRYDVHRLNSKLKRALGDPTPLLLVEEYDDLIRTVIDNIFHSGQTELEELEGGDELTWFIVHTPLFAYRLAEACYHTDYRVWKWARAAIETIDHEFDHAPNRRAPALLPENPLILWGGILSSGYFTEDELPLAAFAVNAILIEVPEERAALFFSQAFTLLSALYASDKGAGVALLCEKLGFPVRPLPAESARKNRIRFIDG